MKKIIILVVVVVALALGGYFIISNKDKETPQTTTPNTSAASSTSTDSSDTSTTQPPTSTETAVITYTDSGFSPSSLTVKAGTVITVQNSSSKTLDFASDDHPSHKINSELNVGDIPPGESGTFTPKVGMWGYHNHLDASDTGQVIVQ